eukprot:COSAG06_NODE_150_length_22019_cov_17.221031_11_plen_115_part_00
MIETMCVESHPRAARHAALSRQAPPGVTGWVVVAAAVVALASPRPSWLTTEPLCRLQTVHYGRRGSRNYLHDVLTTQHDAREASAARARLPARPRRGRGAAAGRGRGGELSLCL